MNQLRVWSILILKEFLTKIFGPHYPREIVTLIVMANYEHIKINCGRFHTTLIKDKIYVLSSCKLYSKVVSCKNVKSVSSGYGHAFALTHIPNEVYIWGVNNHSQLALGDCEMRDSPEKIITRFAIKSIECGADHTIALSTNGKCYAWGYNECGQLGLGFNIGEYQSRELCLSDVVSINCGQYHSIALTSPKKTPECSKSVFYDKCYVWGRNVNGQLGLGHFDNQYTPQELNLNGILSGCVVSIKCGGYHTVALIDKRIYIWGYNFCGQLGLGDAQNRNSPQEIMLFDVVSVHCGEKYTMALTSEGKLYVWGEMSRGQLGLENINHKTRPQHLVLPEPIRSVHCGWNHTVVITFNDRIYGWGSNEYKQLGDIKDTYVPTELTF